MVERLEKRLELVGPEEARQVITALKKPNINPQSERARMPYYAYQLNEEVAKAIKTENPGKFARNLGSKIPKHPLKRVYYGILSAGNLPDKFIEALTNWERVYLYAGKWNIRNPDFSQELPQITVAHLNSGIECLRNYHNKGVLNLPESKRIKKDRNRLLEERELEYPYGFQKDSTNQILTIKEALSNGSEEEVRASCEMEGVDFRENYAYLFR
ncbi:MAG: hypothetical protein U9Q06_03100 [Nanoarchaeota archaeon]|nr:hypothetical protein [Nanoarchaeota archaeon]